MKNKNLTHRFSATGNVNFLYITSKTKFNVVIDGKQNESIPDHLNDFLTIYYFETEDLPEKFEIELYDASDVFVVSDNDIVAEIVPEKCYRLFYDSEITHNDI